MDLGHKHYLKYKFLMLVYNPNFNFMKVGNICLLWATVVGWVVGGKVVGGKVTLKY